MSEVVWQDPPEVDLAANARPSGMSVWQRRLAPFVENPGRWGIAHTFPSQSASKAVQSFKRGLCRLPEGTEFGDWEFTQRKRLEGGSTVYDLYARYSPASSGVELEREGRAA